MSYGASRWPIAVVAGTRGVGALDSDSGSPAMLYVIAVNVPDSAAEAVVGRTTIAAEASVAATVPASARRMRGPSSRPDALPGGVDENVGLVVRHRNWMVNEFRVHGDEPA